jgi:SMI1 / KNR4 family (SUKH-1)
MNEAVAKLLHDFECREPARASDVAEAERAVATQFPESYRAFLRSANGGAGLIGEESYLILWPADELPGHNEGYKPDADYAADLVFIGTDGGNEVFAFRPADGAFVSAPLIGMAPEEVQVRGASFQEFLESFK